jgi:hypothetical protein
MGRELHCKASYGDESGTGKALLETTELIFRGEGRDKAFKFRVPFAKLKKVVALGDRLILDGPGIKAVLEVGAKYAPDWADKIKNPPSRLDKLGVKAGQRVAILDVDDPPFVTELRGRVPETLIGKLHAAPHDLIFFGAATKAALVARLPALKAALAQDGGLWIVRPKGVTAITEADVLGEGKAAGLVDVKVVAFSPTHTAEKLVIPKAARRG